MNRFTTKNRALAYLHVRSARAFLSLLQLLGLVTWKILESDESPPQSVREIMVAGFHGLLY
jgi:hypothetical protein